MTSVILAIDQGTTGSSAAFFHAATLEMLSHEKVEFPQIYPAPGLVEHEPAAIWQSVQKAIAAAWKKLSNLYPDLSKSDIQGIGITNQRETVIGWDRKTGKVGYNAIVWQDRRTANFCDHLKKDELQAERIRRKTGLVCDPYFSGSKMKWLLENSTEINKFRKNGTLIFGTVDSYLIYNLTGGEVSVTDHTNASRTMLYNLEAGNYDDELCSLFGVSAAWLPEIRSSSELLGYTKGVAELPDGIPIYAVLGDQQAALFGHDVKGKGVGKITYGTGAFLLVSTGDRAVFSKEGLLTTVAFSSKKERTFAIEGSAFIAGAAIQFLRDNLNFISDAVECDKLALSAPRDPSLFFVPALTGLGAPYWNPEARGVLFGLTRGTSKAQIARAVLESIALQNVQLLSLIQRATGERISKLGVDGGVTKSDLLMQFQADISGIRLCRTPIAEITARGAAKAALLAITPDLKIMSSESALRYFDPEIDRDSADKLVAGWIKAVNSVDLFYRVK